jgi:hypothetical protein
MGQDGRADFASSLLRLLKGSEDLVQDPCDDEPFHVQEESEEEDVHRARPEEVLLHLRGAAQPIKQVVQGASSDIEVLALNKRLETTRRLSKLVQDLVQLGVVDDFFDLNCAEEGGVLLESLVAVCEAFQLALDCF